ncbi:DNA polymerase IV [bacterium]|nr:MAG: DNA polymerase IV [bacterium]
MIRKIIHIDMDAFYASVEERDNPELKGKPVAVGGSPTGRGVLATANYVARKYGLRSAMSSAQALRLCPKVIFIRPRFEVYKEASNQIREIFEEYTDLIQPLSLDEAYLDVTESKTNNPSATLIAKEIKQKIFDRTQLTASAGVSFNKFLAKVASDFQKPNGLTVITPESATGFLMKLPIGKFHGVGRVTKQKMNLLGIDTGADLIKWKEEDLTRHFGKAGSYYYHIVRGEDDREVTPEHTRKSVGAERTFSTDYKEWEILLTELKTIAEKVSERMQKISVKGKTITVKVRYDDFDTITRSHTTPEYYNESDFIYEQALQLMDHTQAGERKVRLLGIALSNLDNEMDFIAPQQLKLPFPA